jgi:NAD dependent epimerase/dehydratase family enzyme
MGILDPSTRSHWANPSGLVLYLAAGDPATLMTTGQRIRPEKALSGGYIFRYPKLGPALQAIPGAK